MLNISHYNSPLGTILLISKNNKLISLSIDKENIEIFKEEYQEKEEEALVKAKKWLDEYFQGKKPNPNDLSIKLIGSEFQKEVWEIVKTIPYGEIITYKNIAEIIAQKHNRKTMSYQAIGRAVSNNPIAIIIPCHRVIGTNKKLIGYAYGLDKKEYLLNLEKTL